MDNPKQCADSNGRIPQGQRKQAKEYAPASNAVRQQSMYNKKDKPSPDNSEFFEKRSNPLSSKGN